MVFLVFVFILYCFYVFFFLVFVASRETGKFTKSDNLKLVLMVNSFLIYIYLFILV